MIYWITFKLKRERNCGHSTHFRQFRQLHTKKFNIISIMRRRFRAWLLDGMTRRDSRNTNRWYMKTMKKHSRKLMFTLNIISVSSTLSLFNTDLIRRLVMTGNARLMLISLTMALFHLSVPGNLEWVFFKPHILTCHSRKGTGAINIVSYGTVPC